MAPEIERITSTFLSNPARIEVARQSTTSDTITQALFSFKPTRRDTSAKEKRTMLRAAIAAEGEGCTNAIIFCNRKVDVDIVAKSLKKHGLDAAPIHGDLDQSQRMRTLDGFREGSLRFLVASDVAARGLDVPSVSHVFNYDVPSHAEDYVHRIGRTGRAGRKGRAITIAVPADEKYLTAIEALIGKPIPTDEPLPWSPTSAQKPHEADAANDDRDKPRRSRGGRGRRKSHEGDEGSTAKTETKTEAPKEASEDNTPPQPTPSSAAPRPERSHDRHDREGRNRGGQGGGHRVVGIGEHLPSFIALSFDERRGPSSSYVPADAEDEQSQGEAQEIETPVAATEEAPKPKRKRSPRKPKEKLEAEGAETPAEAVSEE
jgi:superfamily II DNA/RNA helicase